MDLILSGPAIYKETHRQQDSAKGKVEKAVLGLHTGGLDAGLLVGGRLAPDVPVGRQAEDDETDEAPDAEAEVRQAHGAGGEAVGALEDVGEGGEEQVQVGVDDGHVEGHDGDDGRVDEHLDGPDDAAPEVVPRGEADVEARVQQLVARLLAQPRRLALQLFVAKKTTS